MVSPPDRPVSFSEVLACEAVEIRRRRQIRDQTSGRSDALLGLAFSGGGIRSAAVSLGAAQALKASGRLDAFDYLSTVSGGGYTGACLNVSMSKAGGGTYPFGEDVRDSPVVAHIRNFSNYLLPRNRSGVRNWLEAAVVILRGLLANAVCVLAFLIPAVLGLVLAFPDSESRSDPNFPIRLAHGLNDIIHHRWSAPAHDQWTVGVPMVLPLLLCGLLALTLLLWATLKSLTELDRATNDTRSVLLAAAYFLLLAVLVVTALDVQPVLITAVLSLPTVLHDTLSKAGVISALLGGMAAVGTLAGRLGRFLESSGRTRRWKTSALRVLARTILIIGALILPALLWLTTVLLYLWTLRTPFSVCTCGSFALDTNFDWLVLAWAVTAVITCSLRSNNYSLHWLYRDRLSQAFLVGPPGSKGGEDTKTSSVDDDVSVYDALKFSALQDSAGPYPIVNCALNVQGSLEANKRGRNADFFAFTPNYAGSALTGYVKTTTIESLDTRFDIGGAMAVSGAAASANMGSHTVRMLSPTLSLLNIRLGYYLRNPRYIGEPRTRRSIIRAAAQSLSDQFFLLIEMFNGLREDRRTIYLTDGGHIENLGIYELLRRRCGLIFVIDAEADPELGCGSLQLLERYARIDLGVRITLPWEQIASEYRETARQIQDGNVHCDHGPHCAIGRVQYPDGASGIIAYVKSSLSGDERDYIVDYARRNPAFPHEATSDQFFSEEQFEMYRALGFHMVQGVFGTDRLAIVEGPEPWGFADEKAARAAVNQFLNPALPGTSAVRT